MTVQYRFTGHWWETIYCSPIFTLLFNQSINNIVASSILFHIYISIYIYIQSTLVISNSLIPNSRLSRRENPVPVLTQRSTNRQQNIVEKRRNCSLGAISPLFHNIFNISLAWESNYIFILLKVFVRLIVFLSSANLICRSTDISKCFIESVGFRDNESRLYIYNPVVVFFFFVLLNQMFQSGINRTQFKVSWFLSYYYTHQDYFLRYSGQ